MKRVLSLLCCLVLLCSMLYGCKKTTNAPVASTGPASGAPPVEVEFAKTDADMFTDRDKKTEYTASECIQIVLNGNTATAGDNSVKISGSTVTITKEATYLVSGSLTDGSLIVNAPEDAKLQIIFNGASITSASSAALYIVEADKVFLTLAKDSDNILANGGSFTTDSNNVDGALFSKQDLTINGQGKLTVTSPAGHGIVCKDDLVLTGGTYAVSAASHGLDANDSIRICDSTLSVTAGKDGFHAENTDDTALGFIYMANSTLTVEAEGDGISAGNYIQSEGGTFDILAGGGYKNGSSASSGQYGDFPGMGGGRPGGHHPGTMPPGSTGTIQDTATDSTSMKGIKAGTGLLLSDGSYTIDSADDAFHSDDAVVVNGGTYAIDSGDDAFHAETTLTITSCTMDVTNCYEGLEAEQIYVMGGSLKLNCSDDGLNAAGGTDSSGSTGGRDGQFGGGGGGRFGGGMMGDVNENALIQISGGELAICAGGDGLDSNGNLTISGGTTTVYNPKAGDTSVLDSQYKPSITGGTYVGLGISLHMVETFSPETSTQGFLACNLGSQDAGTKITVKDGTGKEVFSCTTLYSTSLLILSNASLVKNSNYTVTVGSQSFTVTAS